MSDASRIIELLREKDLLVRNININDRRKMNVNITQKGLAMLEAIELENGRMDKKLATLNEDEILQLNNLLDKLRG